MNYKECFLSTLQGGCAQRASGGVGAEGAAGAGRDGGEGEDAADAAELCGAGGGGGAGAEALVQRGAQDGLGRGRCGCVQGRTIRSIDC
jgi:hypothetical protein